MGKMTMTAGNRMVLQRYDLGHLRSWFSEDSE
jgi:hypothetical protein